MVPGGKLRRSSGIVVKAEGPLLMLPVNNNMPSLKKQTMKKNSSNLQHLEHFEKSRKLRKNVQDKKIN